ncbi:MAG: radical SAM protein [Fibrobacteria bacterium]|nr:radical SAM protein [Fibrobacteria bacterium]
MKNLIPFFINPPVEDFACTNYYSLPFGMLSFIHIIRLHIPEFFYFDFLHEDFANQGEKYTYKKNNLYEYPRTQIQKPKALEKLNRYYRRFGNSSDSFDAYLTKNHINLDTCILYVNTDFTYRGPGIVRFLWELQNQYGISFSNIVLGGTAATLIPEYFKTHLPGIGFFNPDMLMAYTDRVLETMDNSPAFYDVYKNLRFIPFRLNRFCPDKCAYCASRRISASLGYTRPVFNKTASWVESLGMHLEQYTKQFKTDLLIPFDDALMYSLKYLPAIFGRKRYKIYTPNGLHLKMVTPESARLLFQLGFEQLRFGIETLSQKHQEDSSDKIRNISIKDKLNMLLEAGFNRSQIRFYIIYGLEGQRFEDVLETITALKPLGCGFNISGYAPVPGTPMYDRVNKGLNGIFDREPALGNNSTVPLWNPEFSEERIDKIKRACQY